MAMNQDNRSSRGGDEWGVRDVLPRQRDCDNEMSQPGWVRQTGKRQNESGHRFGASGDSNNHIPIDGYEKLNISL